MNHHHFGYHASIDFIHRLVTETPFAKKFELEESNPEWEEFRDSLPKRDRFRLCTQRVIGNAIWKSKKRDLCKYCWMPNPCCACEAIKKVAVGGTNKNTENNNNNNFWINVPSAATQRNLIKPVFLFHHDEFLSPTNSGRIAAICLDAPIVVWGLPGFEEILKKINHLYVEEYPLFLERAITIQNRVSQDGEGKSADENEQQEQQQEQEEDKDSEAFFQNVILKNRDSSRAIPKVSLLYPEDNCEVMETYIRREVLTSETKNNNKNDVQSENNITSSEKVPPSIQNSNKDQDFIIILLDATWPQAHRLNRHLPRNDPINAPPRVGIVIDNEKFGNGLFQPLRKRTRESGCSTLEATAMALSQLILAFGTTTTTTTNAENEKNNNNSIHSILANSVSTTMLWDMALFVDLVVTLKHLPTRAQHEFQGGEIAAIVAQLSKALPAYMNARREDAQAHKPAPVPLEELKANGILAPPPARYCYVCANYVGVNRMEEHCRGVDHRDKFYLRLEEVRQREIERGNADISKAELLTLTWFPRQEAKNNTALEDLWKVQAQNSAREPMRQREEDDDE
jgi:DTW domain-containing protein YfiP